MFVKCKRVSVLWTLFAAMIAEFVGLAQSGRSLHWQSDIGIAVIGNDVANC